MKNVVNTSICIFLFYLFLEKLISGAILPTIFNKTFLPPNLSLNDLEEMNLQKYFMNEFHFLPRTSNSPTMNITSTLIHEIIQQIYINRTNKDKYKLRFSIASSQTESRNEIGINHIQAGVNSTILYFKAKKNKENNSNDINNINDLNVEVKKKKMKPVIISTRFDTSPSGSSAFDSSLHIVAIIEAIKYILNSNDNQQINIENDFVFVFNEEEEFCQLGAKNLIKSFIPDAYYLSLSGFGVGRPFVLFSKSGSSSPKSPFSYFSPLSLTYSDDQIDESLQNSSFPDENESNFTENNVPTNSPSPSKTYSSEYSFSYKKKRYSSKFKYSKPLRTKIHINNNLHKSNEKMDSSNAKNSGSLGSSSVLKALSKVNGLPMISGLSEIGIFNSFESEGKRYRKTSSYSGAEVSFIGNPLFHGTNNDIDSSFNKNNREEEKFVKLILNCILNFLINFKPNSISDQKEGDEEIQEYDLATFGISPFVILIKKEDLLLLANVTMYIMVFVVIINFLMIHFSNPKNNTKYINSSEKEDKSAGQNGNNNRNKENDKSNGFSSTIISDKQAEKYSLLENILFIFKFFVCTFIIFAFYCLYIFIKSVINASSMAKLPIFDLFFFSGTTSLLYIYFLEKDLFLIIRLFFYPKNTRKNKVPKDHKHIWNNLNVWHMLQAIYLTLLLFVFEKSDFVIAVILTVIFYFVFYRFLNFLVLKLESSLMNVFSILMIFSPTILIYSVIYKSLTLSCQDLSDFNADFVPFQMVFFFSVHFGIFILPFYFCFDQEPDKNSIDAAPEKESNSNKESINSKESNNNKTRNNKIVNNIKKNEKINNQTYSKETKQNKGNMRKTNNSKKINPESNNSENDRKNISSQQIKKQNVYENKINTFQLSSKNKRYIVFTGIISFFLYLLFQKSVYSVKTNSTNLEFVVRGTFAQYFYENSNLTELSFIPFSGKRLASKIWREISRKQMQRGYENISIIKYIHNYKGRLINGNRNNEKKNKNLVDSENDEEHPAFVQIIKPGPNEVTFSKQNNVPDKQYERKSYLPNFIETNNPKIKTLSASIMIENYKVRQISLVFKNVSSSVDFIIVKIPCNDENSNGGRCVQKPLKNSYYKTLNTNSKDTVFRIGGFHNSFKFDFIITLMKPVEVTVGFQSFLQTKEMKTFETIFSPLVKRVFDENDVSETVYVKNVIV